MRRLGVWLGAALLVVFALAPSRGADAADARTPTPTVTRSPKTGPDFPGRVYTIFGYRFRPKMIRIAVGETVTWRNGDRAYANLDPVRLCLHPEPHHHADILLAGQLSDLLDPESALWFDGKREVVHRRNLPVRERLSDHRPFLLPSIHVGLLLLSVRGRFTNPSHSGLHPVRRVVRDRSYQHGHRILVRQLASVERISQPADRLLVE